VDAFLPTTRREEEEREKDVVPPDLRIPGKKK